MSHPNHPIVKVLVIDGQNTPYESEISSLNDAQGIVGGLIEAVDLKFGTMYVNEEYLYRYGPTDYNGIASDVAGLGGRPDLMLTGILGPVYITGPVDREGWDTDVTVTARQAVRRVAREATV